MIEVRYVCGGLVAEVRIGRLASKQQFKTALEIIKCCTSVYDPGSRTWLVLTDGFWDEAMQELEREGIPLRIVEDEEQEVKLNGGYPFLYPFQKQGVEFLLRKRRCILADEMGLGKTVQAITAVAELKAFPCLVVCPAFLTQKWRDEIQRWTGTDSIRVVQGGKDLPQAVLEAVSRQHNWYILSAGLLSQQQEKGKKGVWDVLRRGGFRSVVVDEAHFYKNPQARRTRNLHQLVKHLNKHLKAVFLLTGTPLVKDDPREVWSLLVALHPDLDDKDFYRAFMRSFAFYEDIVVGPREMRKVVGGIENEQQLHVLLSRVLLRRLAVDVAEQLPPVVADAVYVPIPEVSELKELLKQFSELSMCALIDRIIESVTGKEEKDRKLLGIIQKIRQEIGRKKAKAVQDWLSEQVQEADKVVCFFEYKNTLNIVKKSLESKGISVYIVTGDVAPDKRFKVLEGFRKEESPAVLLCTTAAAGVGIDMDFVWRGIFVELPWSPAVLVQALKRLHRITTTRPPVITFVVAEDSSGLEKEVYTLLRKAGTFQSVIGSEIVSYSPLGVFPA